MDVASESFLSDPELEQMTHSIDLQRAALWGADPTGGDTVWLGAIDSVGRAVSFIQSVYWEFGSGVVLPQSGILWQNRGTSFKLGEGTQNQLRPGRKPFHTIQPAMALLNDGRTMVYGTMGGEGQPQTQAVVYTRYVRYGQGLQEAVTGPRWLLGRTWGTRKTNLRLEKRFPADVVAALIEAGHDVELVGAFDEVMGHAGAVVRHPSGVIEGAADPRGDGLVAAF
jgi:gamma-glutamyltranspeptidase/glutathione hydrolase